MHIIEITKSNKELLAKFIADNHKIANTFRYFDKRTIDVIDNHILTVLLIDDNDNDNIIGYGHIDYDEKYWLGICIINEHIGKGYGKLIMNYILNHENVKNCKSIHLAVDKSNEIALKLYKKYDFKFVKDCGTYYLMNFVFDV